LLIPKQGLLSAARMLFAAPAEPGRQLPAILEVPGITDEKPPSHWP
jgi:hypothetical protein